MKKLWTVLIFLFFSATQAAWKPLPVSLDRATETEFLRLLTHTDIHVLRSIETYLFYSRGINPGRTVTDLDDVMAHTEYDMLQLEKFALKYPAYRQDINRISGYWFSIRNKITHFYQRGKAVKLYEHYKGLHGKIKLLKSKAGRYRNLTGKKFDLLLEKNLLQAHLLTVLYLANLFEKGNYFQTLLDAETKKMTDLIRETEATKPQGKDIERKKIALSYLNNFTDLLLDDHKDPDKVYDAVNSLHRNLIKIAGL